MPINNDTKASTNVWSSVMILVGIVLVLSGKAISLPTTISDLLEFTGITFIGVFAVSFFYQVLIAEKHFKDFKTLLTSQLKEMDSIQSKCHKLGIVEIFETRNEYERQYPLMSVIEGCPEKGEIICVARSLFHLLNKTGELKKGLENGLTFKFACIDPENVSPFLQDISQLYKSDIDSALMALKGLITWAIKNRAKGSIELKYHNVDLPDSVFMFDSDNNISRLIWDLGFGRDLTEKKVIIFDSEAPMGNDLKNRYKLIYEKAHCKIKYSNENIQCNEFDWSITNETQDPQDSHKSGKGEFFSPPPHTT